MCFIELTNLIMFPIAKRTMNKGLKANNFGRTFTYVNKRVRRIRVMLDNEPKDLLIVYLCETETEDVKLSFEHSEYVWADEAKCRELLPKMIVEDIERNGVFEVLGGQPNGK